MESGDDKVFWEFRAAEIRAMIEDIRKDLGKPIPVAHEVVCESLGQWLEEAAKAREAGQQTFLCEDPVRRQIGFIVDEADTLYLLPLTRMKEVQMGEDGGLPEEVVARLGHTVESFKQAIRDPEGREALFTYPPVLPTPESQDIPEMPLEQLWEDAVKAEAPVEDEGFYENARASSWAVTLQGKKDSEGVNVSEPRKVVATYVTLKQVCNDGTVIEGELRFDGVPVISEYSPACRDAEGNTISDPTLYSTVHTIIAGYRWKKVVVKGKTKIGEES